MASPALRFGRYESLFRISAGGMAEVFAARVRGEGGFEKIVAVKRILPHLLHDGRFVRMFLDEARVAAYISSQHVVQTLDIGRDDSGAPYLAMELVVGLTLAEILKQGAREGWRLPLAVAIEILAQAAAGLDSAHEARTPRGEPLALVHRDMSPQNVLVGADGIARVSDFGVAQVALSRLEETQAGELKGKFAYCSPEQSRHEPLDRRSDVFSLGIVAWETLTGRRLFASPSPLDTIQAVRHAAIPRIDEVCRDLSPALASVVAKALERDPAKRWQTARAFGAALRNTLGPDLSEIARPEHVARFLARIQPERILQLQDRIRQATATPDVETLSDIVIEDAGSGPDIVGEAVTRLGIANVTTGVGVGQVTTAPLGDGALPTAVAPRTSFTDAQRDSSAPRERRMVSWVVAIAVVAMLAIGGVALSGVFASEDDDIDPVVTVVDVAPSPVLSTPEAPVGSTQAAPVAAAPPDPALVAPEPEVAPPPAVQPVATNPPNKIHKNRPVRVRDEPPAPAEQPAPPPTKTVPRRTTGPLGLEAFDQAVRNPN